MYSTFHEAVLHSDIESADNFLTTGLCDVNVGDHNNRTALTLAVNHNDLKMVKWLLEKGANVNAIDNDGKSALHVAAWMDFFDVAKLLVENGADPNLRDTWKKRTPLHFAAGSTLKTIGYPKPDIVKLLLENKADAKILDEDGRTALDVVLRWRQLYPGLCDEQHTKQRTEQCTEVKKLLVEHMKKLKDCTPSATRQEEHTTMRSMGLR